MAAIACSNDTNFPIHVLASLWLAWGLQCPCHLGSQDLLYTDIWEVSTSYKGLYLWRFRYSDITKIVSCFQCHGWSQSLRKGWFWKCLLLLEYMSLDNARIPFVPHENFQILRLLFLRDIKRSSHPWSPLWASWILSGMARWMPLHYIH